MTRIPTPVVRLLLLLLCAGLSMAAFAQNKAKGYKIVAEIEGFSESEAYLANYFMDKQYIVDTAAVIDGKAIFKGDEPLKQGTYLLVLPPDNDFAQLQIDADQEFNIKTKAGNLVPSMKVRGSAENELFYDYLHFLSIMRPAADSLRAIQADSTLPEATRMAAKVEGERIDAEVKERQAAIKAKHPKTITASILRSMEEPSMPEFVGTEEEKQQQRYLFYKKHYFDNVDLGDPRAIRSSYLDQRISYYLDKLVVPVPDSLNKEIDYILEQMKPAPETFRFYVSKFLNDYAKSKVVGMDAVYAHLGEKYYVSGIANWTDSTTVAKIAENVERIKPLLLGKPAPPLTLEDRKGNKIDLYKLEADYVVLFFYDPECGHCKKQTPFVIDFAKAYQDKDVKVVSVCSKFAPNQDSCWNYVDSKVGMNDAMYNAVDPYHRSKFKINYDISSTPQIYVLDREKKIVSKKISAEQLDEVVSRLISIREEQEIEQRAGGKP